MLATDPSPNGQLLISFTLASLSVVANSKQLRPEPRKSSRQHNDDKSVHPRVAQCTKVRRSNALYTINRELRFVLFDLHGT